MLTDPNPDSPLVRTIGDVSVQFYNSKIVILVIVILTQLIEFSSTRRTALNTMPMRKSGPGSELFTQMICENH